MIKEYMEKYTNRVDSGHKDYWKYRIASMMRSIKKDTGKSVIGPMDLVVSVRDKAENGDYSYKTLNLYKNKIMSELKSDRTDEARHAMILLDRIELRDGCTETNRTKHLTYDELLKVCKKCNYDYKTYPNSKYSLMLSFYMRAAYCTGLRPGEWECAKVSLPERDSPKPMEKMRLIVKNAKHDNERGFGEYRTLILDGLSKEDKESVITFLRMLKETRRSGIRFDKVRKGLQMKLYRINKALFPDRDPIQLYTTRHAFKTRYVDVYSPIELAALMGHKSINSARAYGSGSGEKSVKYAIRPSLEDIDAVRQFLYAEKNMSIREIDALMKK